MRLFISSLLTIGLMAAMLLSILATAFFALGFFDIFGIFAVVLLLLLTTAMFLVFWLLGPFFNDIIYSLFYKIRWIDTAALNKRAGGAGDYLAELCSKENIKLPKIGYIEDDNPTAFTYGSGPWNARLVISNGIVKYLDAKEVKAVIAHEVGHIAHLDFVVMTVASMIVTLLYEIAWMLWRGRSRRSGGSREEKGADYLVLIGLISYIFYRIAQFLLLYLSRVREYYADEFAGLNAGANNLSTALIKISYGIIAAADTEKTTRLMESTRAQGIFDFKLAKNFGLNYLTFRQSGSYSMVENAMVYDKKNPWAFLTELGSTHPLTGKRILRLSELAAQQGEKKLFDAEKVKNYPVNNGKMYGGFVADLILGTGYVPLAAGGLLFLISILLGNLLLGIGFFILAMGMWGFVGAFYRYPGGEAKHKSIDESMADIYASPARGRPVAYQGKIIGRGIAGMIFSEDMMFADSSGIIYLDYQSIIPIIGNLFFAWTKVEKMIGQNASVSGWFFRGLGQAVVVNRITNSGTISSHQKTWAFIAAALISAAGLLVTLLGFAGFL